MIEPNNDGRTNSLSVRPHKYRTRSLLDVTIDRLRPLTFHSHASDLAVEHVLLYPEKDRVVISLVTGGGTAIYLMPRSIAREIGEGLISLSNDRE
jgi:hypothetical protein